MNTPIGNSEAVEPAYGIVANVNPNSITSGSSSTCTVTLSQNAPSGGSSVALSSNNSALEVPSSVTVASGSSSANFTATSGTVLPIRP